MITRSRIYPSGSSETRPLHVCYTSYLINAAANLKEGLVNLMMRIQESNSLPIALLANQLVVVLPQQYDIDILMWASPAS